jgi:hypothetical protein
MQVNGKRSGLCLLRWQASTSCPRWCRCSACVHRAAGRCAIGANPIGGLIFFWVNQFIITPQSLAARREIKEDITCVDCGKIARGYRLVRSGDHYRTSDREPEFRCEECSTKKSDELRKRGVRGEAGYPFQCREPDIKKFKISS